MNAKIESRFVLFPLGEKRFALPAEQVTELAQPDILQTFPHTTRLLSGVLLRRGRIIPVLDVAEVLMGPGGPPRKFYLIATRKCAGGDEWTAVPVSGDCELKKWEMIAPKMAALPKYVIGVLAFPDETVEVIDLNKLALTEVA
jgi:chemotaxis signal transduction protein